MKKINPFIIPAILFSLLGIALAMASVVINFSVAVVVALLCALKFWILYFMEVNKRRKEKTMNPNND